MTGFTLLGECVFGQPELPGRGLVAHSSLCAFAPAAPAIKNAILAPFLLVQILLPRYVP